MSTRSVHITNGREFPYPLRFYIVIILSITGVIITGQVLPLLFALIGIYGLSARRGTIFSPTSYKRYFSVFGIKFGTFEPIPQDACLVLLPVKYSTRGGTHGGQLTVQEHGLWELFLVNAQHRDKRSVGKSENKVELEERAAEVEALCGVNLEPFAPAISQATRQRKRR